MRGEARLGDLALVLVASVAMAAAGRAALALDGAWATPFVAQEPGQRALLAARAAALLLAVMLMPRDRAHAKNVALASALFIASVALRGLFAPAFVLTGVAVRRSGRRAPSPAPAWATAATAIVAAVPALAIVRAPAAAPAAADGSPAAQVAAWRSRGNLFHAHAVADAWARSETVPGEGYLALAEIDHEIGHGPKAAKVLAKILASPAPDAVQQAAREDKARWGLP